MTAQIIQFPTRAPAALAPSSPALNPAQQAALDQDSWKWNRKGDLEFSAQGYRFTASPLGDGRASLKIDTMPRIVELPIDEYLPVVVAMLATG